MAKGERKGGGGRTGELRREKKEGGRGNEKGRQGGTVGGGEGSTQAITKGCIEGTEQIRGERVLKQGGLQTEVATCHTVVDSDQKAYLQNLKKVPHLLLYLRSGEGGTVWPYGEEYGI